MSDKESFEVKNLHEKEALKSFIDGFPEGTTPAAVDLVFKRVREICTGNQLLVDPSLRLAEFTGDFFARLDNHELVADSRHKGNTPAGQDVWRNHSFWKRADINPEERRRVLKIAHALLTQIPAQANRGPVEIDEALRIEINRFLERRSQIFAKYLGGKWSNERVVVRKLSSEFPQIEYGGDIVGADSLNQTLARLKLRPSVTETELRDSLHKAFLDVGGSRLNDPVALWHPLNREWWEQPKLKCSSLDYLSLRLIQDRYLELVGANSHEMEAGYPSRPLIPGANGVIVKMPDLRAGASPFQRKTGLLLQRRPEGRVGGNNEERLSLLGGAFRPRFGDGFHDHGSLARTAIREIFEEGGVQVVVPHGCCVAWVEEIKPRSQIQFSFLGAMAYPDGVNFADQAYDREVGENPEGHVEVLDIAELDKCLYEGSFELSCHGVASILAWFALGCPGLELQAARGKRVLENVIELSEAALISQTQLALESPRWSRLANPAKRLA